MLSRILFMFLTADLCFGHMFCPSNFLYDLHVKHHNGSRMMPFIREGCYINARRLPLAPLVYALMTTSVGNNSVFRSFFEIQKLTRPNFIDWYRQLRLVLSTEDKEYYLEHHIPEAPVAPPGQQVPPAAAAAHAAWVKGQKEVVVLMLLTLDLEIQ
ncbi:hypothetical protein Tco_1074145 [Tanacetum coccineum]